MTDNDDTNDAQVARLRAISSDLSRAFQLIEIECAIHGGGATDQDAHAFIDGLGDDENGVREALHKLRSTRR
jgi:hypothetical protein